ncbi:hypothetical protein [Halobacillus halophilus]|uniref:hypothetical protein n=1 Tax=Halobacillus halophilus TaxID=1570 RepID=UPI001CD5200C|nr:hypothetical protein [Halobacillus halophilus]MCA1012804.1 hypothetical protein [Halobacillus halophilus]
MKLYAREKATGQIVEVVSLQNTKSKVGVICPAEGHLSLQKNDIDLIGFRNGKGATGELQCPNEDDRKDIEHYVAKNWIT